MTHEEEANKIVLDVRLSGWLDAAKTILQSDNPFFTGGACVGLVQEMVKILEERSK